MQAGGPLHFSPGQWVDFYAPNVPYVGGYSICSPPSQMEKFNTFDLAVKLSSYSPAMWLHNQVSGAVSFNTCLQRQYLSCSHCHVIKL